MADLKPQERLQPALLDRLMDDEPDKKVESRERQLLNRTQLRQAALRDLAWLFNATRLGDLVGNPHAEKSVVNFGLPSLSGETASTLDVVALESAIRNAILTFEPRVMAETLQVEALVSDLQLDHHSVISIQIRGDLWAQPLPIELLLRTELDLETGAVEVRDLGKSGA
jgi:type VI secretion system protein ImpF